jgi:hypothetical protein
MADEFGFVEEAPADDFGFVPDEVPADFGFQEDLPETNKFDAAVRSIAKGLTFDQADAVAGFLRAITEETSIEQEGVFGMGDVDPQQIERLAQVVEEKVAEERAITDQVEAENPFITVPGEIAGFIAGPGKFIKAGKGTFAAAELAGRAGLVGATGAFIQGGDPRVGAAIGALLPPVLKGGGQLLRATGATTGRITSNIATKISEVTGLSPLAAKVVTDVGVAAQGALPPSVTSAALKGTGTVVEKAAGTATAAQGAALGASKFKVE